MYPQKVFKGKKMPGRMGHERVTVKNLEVAYVDVANNLIGLKGAVPGPRKGLITIGGKA
jgi:large subunit ribosomal protein L3